MSFLEYKFLLWYIMFWWLFVKFNFIKRFSQKRFYSRSTNRAAFCAIQWMSFNPPFPFYGTQIINPFLIQGSQPIEILANCETLIPLNVPLVSNLFLFLQNYYLLWQTKMSTFYIYLFTYKYNSLIGYFTLD